MEKKAFIEKLAREAYEKGSFNGTWLYAENGKIVSKGAYGWRDAENKLPMQEDTIFEMASITKMFTATYSLPSLARSMTAVAVNIFVIEAISKMVSSCMGSLFSASRKP